MVSKISNNNRNTMIDTLADEARKFVDATADVADEKIQTARRKLSGAVSQWSEGIGDAVDHAKEAQDATLEYLKADPIRALGIGVGIGFVLGFLLKR